jgi:hypothetical protein
MSKTLPLLLFASLSLHAAPITVTHTFIGAGTLGGTEFPLSTIVFTGVGDTGNVLNDSPNVFELHHSSATILIDGLGAFDVLTGTLSAVIDFSSYATTVLNSTSPGYAFDILGGPYSASLVGYQLQTSIGPIDAPAMIFNMQANGLHSAMLTSGGLLELSRDGITRPGSFQVFVGNGPSNPGGSGEIPEPATTTLLGFGLAALAFARHRRH